MKFLITGTHAYGPVSPNSDLDIVIMLDDVHEVMTDLAEKGIEICRTPGQGQYDDNGDFYFNLAGMEINIIVANDAHEFEEWYWRTERMKGMPDFHDKEERVAIFNYGKKEAKSVEEDQS